MSHARIFRRRQHWWVFDGHQKYTFSRIILRFRNVESLELTFVYKRSLIFTKLSPSTWRGWDLGYRSIGVWGDFLVLIYIYLGPLLSKRRRRTGIGILIMNIRGSDDRLRFIMGNPTPMRRPWVVYNLHDTIPRHENWLLISILLYIQMAYLRNGFFFGILICYGGIFGVFRTQCIELCCCKWNVIVNTNIIIFNQCIRLSNTD